MSGQRHSAQGHPGQAVGSSILAMFGMVYVLINAGTLPAVVSVPLRLIAIAVFVAVMIGAERARRASLAHASQAKSQSITANSNTVQLRSQRCSLVACLVRDG